SVVHGGLGGQQVVDLQFRGDGSSDEAIGRGDDQNVVSACPVQGNQLPSLGQDHRLYRFAHELFVPASQGFRIVLLKRLQGESEEGPRIQVAGQILLVEPFVLL